MRELKDSLYEGYLEEKKSRFFSSLLRVETEEEIHMFLSEYRKRHPKANHVVYAYRLGHDHIKSFCHDDGEPSQTSGAPMLTVLTEEGLTNVLAIVVRYFGGTKLGKGGLIRAYSDAVKDALAVSQFKSVVEVVPVIYHYDYTYHASIERRLKSNRIHEIVYDDQVHLSYYRTEDQLDDELIELTGGSIKIEQQDKTTILMEEEPC